MKLEPTKDPYAITEELLKLTPRASRLVARIRRFGQNVAASQPGPARLDEVLAIIQD
jgi:hypothetical protein